MGGADFVVRCGLDGMMQVRWVAWIRLHGVDWKAWYGLDGVAQITLVA
jgi:hypothetical protein